jgi:NIMA (never in mitosis gene a)-related kinase
LDEEEDTGKYDKQVADMCKEVEIISTLDHPNIVKYHSWFVETSSLYIVMEHVDGSSLADFLTAVAEKRQKLSEERIWRLFMQLCLAIAHMHTEKRIAHRDLNPANVMIHRGQTVKIADFGLARQQRDNSLVMKSIVGTITFSCPEIVMHQEYTMKADIWSLGCILYQLAMLRPPFGGSNPLTVAQKIVAGDIEPISDEYSPLLHKTVRALLSVKPEARPDIMGVSALIAPLLLSELGKMSASKTQLEESLQIEQQSRKRSDEDRRGQQSIHRRTRKNSKHLNASDNDSDSEDPSLRLRSRSRSHGGHAAFPGAQTERSSKTAPSPALLLPLNGGGGGVGGDADPLFVVLHKLVYVEQLPPLLKRHPKRLLLGQYKRIVCQGNAVLLQAELKRLYQALPDYVAVLESGLGRRRARCTYEELSVMLEEVLEETTYYTRSPPEKEPPTGATFYMANAALPLPLSASTSAPIASFSAPIASNHSRETSHGQNHPPPFAPSSFASTKTFVPLMPGSNNVSPIYPPSSTASTHSASSSTFSTSTPIPHSFSSPVAHGFSSPVSHREGGYSAPPSVFAPLGPAASLGNVFSTAPLHNAATALVASLSSSIPPSANPKDSASPTPMRPKGQAPRHRGRSPSRSYTPPLNSDPSPPPSLRTIQKQGSPPPPGRKRGPAPLPTTPVLGPSPLVPPSVPKLREPSSHPLPSIANGPADRDSSILRRLQSVQQGHPPQGNGLPQGNTKTASVLDGFRRTRPQIPIAPIHSGANHPPA